ncbi:hypothetical protein WA158_003727 [Blastocystis sp. Blastoise]
MAKGDRKSKNSPVPDPDMEFEATFEDAIPGVATFIGIGSEFRYQIPVKCLQLYPNCYLTECYLNSACRVDHGLVSINYPVSNLSFAIAILEGEQLNIDGKNREQLESMKTDLDFFKIPIPPNVFERLRVIEDEERQLIEKDNAYILAVHTITTQLDTLQEDISNMKTEIESIKNQSGGMENKLAKRLICQEAKIQVQNESITKIINSLQEKMEEMIKDHEKRNTEMQNSLLDSIELLENRTNDLLNNAEEKHLKQYNLLSEALNSFKTTTDQTIKTCDTIIRDQREFLENSLMVLQTKAESVTENQNTLLKTQQTDIANAFQILQASTDSMLANQEDRTKIQNESTRATIKKYEAETTNQFTVQDEKNNLNNSSMIQIIDVARGSIETNLKEQELKLQKVSDSMLVLKRDLETGLPLTMNPHPEYSFINNELLNSLFAYKLLEWTGLQKKWNQTYLGSRDGFKAKDFHRFCDSKGETIVIIKSEIKGVTNIFGGYSKVGWIPREGEDRIGITDPNAIIFSLQNAFHLPPQCFKCQSDEYSLCYNRNWGPCFNGAININDECNANSNSYIDNDNENCIYEKHPTLGITLFVNSNDKNKDNYFKVQEIEVFTRLQ